MNREEIIENNPIVTHVQDSCGCELKRIGGKLATNMCPITVHKDNHFCVNIDPDKQVWFCNDCKEGGSVIDWKMKAEGMSTAEAMLSFDQGGIDSGNDIDGKESEERARPTAPEASIQETYDYTDENGRLQYQVLRYQPKTFKQRQPKDGDWQWNLEGITRVLYNLPRVLLSSTVCVTEGEKDANTLIQHGLAATTNAGGSSNWLDAYSETLAGKDVLLFRDMDAAGSKHAETVTESIREKANSVKIIQMPKGFKDISDYLGSMPQDKQLAAVNKLIDNTPHLIEPLPIYSLREREDMYRDFVNSSKANTYSMSKFSPKFAGISDGLMPGEVVILVGDTSTGKTAVMQAIARSAAPMPVLFFELELPASLMFQREVQMGQKCFGRDVRNDYEGNHNSYIDKYTGMDHVFLCPQAGISMKHIENYIGRSSLKIGSKPNMVMIDYMGLVRDGRYSSRYEQIAHTAEQAKVVAKRTNTILFIGSQVARPADKKSLQDVELHSAKGAGEIESSGNLVLGLSRPKPDKLRMKVIKHTNGPIGDIIDFNFDGATMQITEEIFKQPF